MIEILPIKLLTEEDAPIFGKPNVDLGKLTRVGLPIALEVVVTAPALKLKTTLEHFDFGKKEVFEQNLTLVKREIAQTPIPQLLRSELGKHRSFFLNRKNIKGAKNLWLSLLEFWLEEVKNRLWQQGFYKGLTEGLEPQVVVFVKKIKAFGKAFFDPMQDEVVINVKDGRLHPADMKNLAELVKEANKKLFIPCEYEWILDQGIKLTKVLPYTPSSVIAIRQLAEKQSSPDKIAALPSVARNDNKSAVKVFLDLSTGLTIEKNVDGVYIDSGKIFNLEKPQDSYENLVFKMVESAVTFADSPVLFKLADMSEGMGTVRGTLRLLHQQSLLTPLLKALDFTRHKKGLTNVHTVVPFVRSVSEFLQIKRDLAVKKLSRKNSLQLWLEICVPENIINLEEYLLAGLDGVVLNLDELISHLNGFDHYQQELSFYKKEVRGLLKFLEDGVRLLHKAKIPFIACGSLTFYPEVMDFLVEKGVWGMVVERYEASSAYDLLNQVEKRVVLARAS